MAAEAKVPTEEEIAALPRWAKAAFAARCARRVLPLFTRFWRKAPSERIKAVREAVELAERSAAERFDRAVDEGAGLASTAAANAGAPRAATVAGAAASAVHAASTAGPGYAHYAAFSAAYVAREVVPYPCQAALGSAIRLDLATLLARAEAEKWTDDTPVPPWVFGPMWPDGVPDNWPFDDTDDRWPEADPDDRLVITVAAPPGATAEQIANLRTRLYEAANKLVLAHGGPGLTLDRTRRLVAVNVLVPEGA